MEDLTATLERLEWPGVEMPYCMTLVEGIAEDEVIRRLGGDPERTQQLSPQQYWDLHLDDDAEERCFVGVTTVGGVVVAVEHNTYAGNVPGVLRSLSVGGRAFTMLNHIEAKDNIGYAVDGELVIYEEPWGPLTLLRPGDPRWDPHWCDGLADEEADVWLRGERMLALAERVMTCLMEPAWCTEPLRSAPIPNPDDVARTDAWDIP